MAEKDFAEFRALIKAADEGKPDAARKLREYLAANEWAVKLGDLSAHVMAALMDKLVKGASNRELFSAQVGAKKRELGYADASGIEQMLIERVVMCWLRVIEAESYCNRIGGTVTTVKEGDFAEHSLTRSNGRFLRACDALERYRLMVQVTKIAKAKADRLDAKTGEARMNKSNAAMRLLKSATS